ncbi:MAG: endolytic transglycosylase MltG [Collinsella sp.]
MRRPRDPLVERRRRPQRVQAPSQARAHGCSGGVHPAYAQAAAKRSKLPVIFGVLIAIAVVAVAAVFVFPRVFGGSGEAIEAGQPVNVVIPEGATGDVIAQTLVENHVVEDAGEYYAAVKKLGAEMQLKPGEYRFETLQDPISVVKQLVAGPNVEGVKLTVPEGKTVAQTARIVEEIYGIPADDFIAQAKASNYVADFAFLSEAADDSLEGFLFPKTYTFQGTPTADQIIRAMLGQFQVDVLDALDFNAGLASIKARFGVGLTAYQLLDLASIVEREGLHAEQRSHVASVFLNRLAGKGDFAGRPYLQSDATLMYVTGGEVTANDIQTIDSPYNSYKNAGLPPTPICSPSAEAINATLNPTDSNDLYFFITQDEEFFSRDLRRSSKSWE